MSQRTRARKGEPLRFLEQAIVAQTDECIVWPFARAPQGYGRVQYGSSVDYTHRIVLERTAGPPPDPKMHAAHAPLVCHNRACVNPRHLRWATAVDNSADMQLDGTQFHSRGELSGKAKLTEAQVLAIRADPRSHRTVAAAYGIAKVTVTQIKARTRWAHLDESMSKKTHDRVGPRDLQSARSAGESSPFVVPPLPNRPSRAKSAAIPANSGQFGG